jgi:hypothetical protein
MGNARIAASEARRTLHIDRYINDMAPRELGIPSALRNSVERPGCFAQPGKTMLRAEFDQHKKPVELKLEGRLVGPWAVQVKALVSRHFIPAGLLVDISEVTYVDSVGEQLLMWLRDLHASFVAETCYARDVCERLRLTLKYTHRATQSAS